MKQDVYIYIWMNSMFFSACLSDGKPVLPVIKFYSHLFLLLMFFLLFTVDIFRKNDNNEMKKYVFICKYMFFISNRIQF